MALTAFITLAIFCALPGETLMQSEFETLHETIKPSDDPWKSIRWQTSLIEGQNLAAKEKKPMFIWAMDGHPLGCT